MQVAGKTYSSDTRQRRGHGVREGGLSQQAQRKERRSSRQGPLRRPHGKQQASSLSVFHKAHPAFFSPSEPFPRWRPPRTCLPKGWTKTSLSVSKRLGGRNRQRADRAARPLLPPSVAAQPCTRVAGTGLVTAAAGAAGLWEMLSSISEVDRKLGAAEASAAPGFGGPRPSPGQGAAPAGSRRTPARSVSPPATRGSIYGHRCGSACAQVVSKGGLLTDVPEEQSR